MLPCYRTLGIARGCNPLFPKLRRFFVSPKAAVFSFHRLRKATCMLFKAQFEIVESPAKVIEPITKFGGQPIWIAPPLWPLSPETGEQMTFLGQIALTEHIFPNSNGRIVYLFFSNESEPLYNEAFAATIQLPGEVYTGTKGIEFVAMATGPSLYELDINRQIIYKEYKVIIFPEEEEISVPLQERYNPMTDVDYTAGFNFSKPELAGNKIGGQPLYIGHLTNPPQDLSSDQWLLLMQLAPLQGYWKNLQPNFYPFQMELGEFGILTVLISLDYAEVSCNVQQP